MNRRRFIQLSGMAGGWISGLPRILRADSAVAATATLSARADLNHIRKWDESNGDTWDPFWADDGQLYSFNCDGRGFGKDSRNLAFNLLSGDSLETLTGFQVNSMDEYGKADQRGADHATWKVCGQECIDGVFYAFVARNVYGHESHDPLMRQTSLNASLIRSDDRGKSWKRSVTDNYAHPLWSGGVFGAPYFIHYGQNGGTVERDRATDFVYAISNNGFWNDGDYLILARVARSRIGRLEAGDWQYYRGDDGIRDANWCTNPYEASPILVRQARCGETSITWVPALSKYLLVSWYNPEPLPAWFTPKEMRYDILAADHPWGKWEQVGSFSDKFLTPGKNMYGPSLCARFQQEHPGRVIVPMFTSGCQFEDEPTGLYKAWMIPLEIRTDARKSREVLKAESERFRKTGRWEIKPTDAGYDNAALFSHAIQDALEFDFDGRGFELAARKAQGYGSFRVIVDGIQAGMVTLGIRNFPEIFGAKVFEESGLGTGRHRVRIVNSGYGQINLQSAEIFA